MEGDIFVNSIMKRKRLQTEYVHQWKIVLNESGVVYRPEHFKCFKTHDDCLVDLIAFLFRNRNEDDFRICEKEWSFHGFIDRLNKDVNKRFTFEINNDVRNKFLSLDTQRPLDKV